MVPVRQENALAKRVSFFVFCKVFLLVVLPCLYFNMSMHFSSHLICWSCFALFSALQVLLVTRATVLLDVQVTLRRVVDMGFVALHQEVARAT